jgi:hypothetical protein
MAIGISFIPSAQGLSASQPANPQGGANTDLAQAYKILSLRLPQIMGSSAISPLVGSPGSNTNALKGTNPYTAVFQALLQSMGGGLGGGAPIDTTGLVGQGSTDLSPAAPPISSAPAPSIIFKQPRPDSGAPPSAPSDAGAINPFGGDKPGKGAEY